METQHSADFLGAKCTEISAETEKAMKSRGLTGTDFKGFAAVCGMVNLLFQKYDWGVAFWESTDPRYLSASL